MASDLRLALTETDGQYRVILTRLSDGVLLATDSVETDVAACVQDLLVDFSASTTTPFQITGLVSLGRSMADLALPPAVRVGLQAALMSEADPAATLQLRLLCDGALLEDVPWEFLTLDPALDVTDASALSDGLGLHPRLRLVREQPLRGLAVRSDAVTLDGPLRVLLAHADPRAPGYGVLPGLMAEIHAIRAALVTIAHRVQIKELPEANPLTLRRYLREWKPHVLHLSGHADTQPTGDVFVLQGEREGEAAFVYADELAEWLRGTPVRLVTLSGCRTAGHLARTLSASGVAAVVAMQMPLRDASAGLFAQAFYATLLQPSSVQEAVAQGRQSVRGMGFDWGVPVLRLAAGTGDLFAWPSASVRHRPVLPPTNVPHRASDAFVGRGDLLAEMHRILIGGSSAALVGLGGLGKTQLAVEYAYAHRADYPGGVFWVGAHDTRSLMDDLTSVAHQFFDAPKDWSAADSASWARDALSHATDATLLVADNVGPNTDLSCLPPTGACRLLLTTQEGYLVPKGLRVFILPVLKDDAALSLLGAAEEAEGEREAALEVVSLLGGLPLALALVQHHVHRLDLSWRDYQERLASAPFETLQQARRRFVTPTAHHGSLYDVLALSLRSLPVSAVGLLTVFAAFGSRPVPTDLLLESSAMGSPPECDEAVADLVDAGIVVRGEWGLTVHELVRVFVWEQTAPETRIAVVARTASVLSRRLSLVLDRGRFSAISDEIIHADSVAARCLTLGLNEELIHLLLPLGRLAHETGRFALAWKHYDNGLLLLETVGWNEREAAPYLRERSESRYSLEDKTGALSDARSALASARRAFGRRTPALVDYYTQVGFCLRHLKQFRRARPFYERALASAQAAHGRQHPRVADVLTNLGTLMKHQRNWSDPEIFTEHHWDLDAALALQTEALAIYRSTLGPTAVLVAVALNNLGRLLVLLKRCDEALSRHQEALFVYETAYGRQNPNVAASLYYVGEAERGLGHEVDARSHYQQSLNLFEYFYGLTNYRCDIVRSRLSQ